MKKLCKGAKRIFTGTQSLAENLNLMFTFRGIPQITYGTEVEFNKDNVLDVYNHNLMTGIKGTKHFAPIP